MKSAGARNLDIKASPGALFSVLPGYFSSKEGEIALTSFFIDELISHFTGEIQAFSEIFSVTKAFLLQLGKLLGTAFSTCFSMLKSGFSWLLKSIETASLKLKKTVTKEKVLDEVKQGYSAQSTSELTQEYLALGIGEAVKLVGVILGPVLWIVLKLCPLQYRRKILGFLSPFRSAFKSVTILQKTGAMTGLHALQSPAASIAAGAIGGIVGLSLTNFIADEIKKIEDGFNQCIKLNQLLKNHLATNADPRIPEGLDDAMLILWLENPHYSPNLDLAVITKSNFREANAEELKRYYWYKLFAEIINGAYSVSVLNSDLGQIVQLAASVINFMTGVTNMVINYAMAALNAVLLSVSLYSYGKIAQHQVDEFGLKIKQSYLQANTELTKKAYEASVTFCPTSDGQTEENADDVNVLSPSFVRSKEHDAWVEAKCEQRRCEEQLVTHQKNSPRNAHLTNAAVRGFNEGSGVVAFFMGVPIAALVAAHLIALTCWPVFLVLAITTITVGSYCAYENYKEKKQKLAAGVSEEAIEPEKSTPSEEIELKTFSASFESDEIDETDRLDETEKSAEIGFVVQSTEKTSPSSSISVASWFGSLFSPKRTNPRKIENNEIELNSYSYCAVAA